MAGHPIYRGLLRLYPASFRRRYGDDLVQHLSDLTADRGVREAWARTFVDLAVTVPRYRMESVMNERHSASATYVAIWLLVGASVITVLCGIAAGVVLLAAAVALAVVQRGPLGRALRTPDPNRRRRRLTTAAVLAVVFVTSYTAYTLLIGDTWTVRETLLAAVGIPAMFGAVGFLVAGLLTPRPTEESRVVPSS